MTYPPPPGQWDPGASEPEPLQPPSGYYPPPGWNPQPPPQKQSGLKWLLIGLSVLMVVAIAIGGTLLITRGDSGTDGKTSTTSPPGASDFASANDTGPVSIITSDPTCVPWRTIQNALANAELKEWRERDPASEPSTWSPQLRAQYEAVGAAMRNAADQVVSLAKLTPHRVIREIYEQFIVYGRSYADSLSTYEPKDDLLSRIAGGFSTSIAAVCEAIDPGGIAARTSDVPGAQSPTDPPNPSGLSDPRKFISKPSSACVSWIKSSASFVASLADWGRLDSGIPATAWSEEQRSVQEGAATSMRSYATTMVDIGRQAGGTFEDFAVFASLYLRAYASATNSYVLTDSYVNTPGLRLNGAIVAACKAEAG